MSGALKPSVSVWLWAYFAVCSSCQTSVSQFGSFFPKFTTSEAKEILSFREVFEYASSPHCYNFITAKNKYNKFNMNKCKVKRKLNDYPVHERMHFLPLCFPSYLKMSLNIDCRFLTFPSSFKEPGAAAVATEDRLLSKQALRDSPKSGLCKLTEFNLKNLILLLTLLPRLYVGR